MQIFAGVGGASAPSTVQYLVIGGGGAGAVGAINTGGAGLSSSITGSAVTRGVGGSVANPGVAVPPASDR